VAHVVSAHDLRPLRSVITDGYASTQQCTGGVRALGLEQMGTRRIDANLRSRSQGPQRPGPGRPKTYDGKGHWDDLARCAPGEPAEDAIVLAPPVLHHVQCQWTLRGVVVVDTTHPRRAVLLSPDGDLDALTLSRDDTARCHSECLVRDAKQCPGLIACQARSQAQLPFPFHARLSAVTLAKLAARQHQGEVASAFSMVRLKRRAFNPPRIERLSQYVATGHSLEKSSPAYEQLCNYGTITETAA
jgi:hypothetical protein